MSVIQTISVKQAARRKGCSLKWIYDLLAAGRLPGAKKVARCWAIPLASIAPAGKHGARSQQVTMDDSMRQSASV